MGGATEHIENDQCSLRYPYFEPPFHPMFITPEQQARERIDQLLAASGWAVQDKKDLNPAAGRLRQAVLERAFERRIDYA